MYGKKIKLLRQHLGLTQAELAQRLEISSPALSKIESNITNPSAETTAKLIAAFDVNLNWLYSDQGAMFNAPTPQTDTLQEANERPYRDSASQRASYQLLLKLSDTQEKLIEQIEANKRLRAQFAGWLQKMEQSGASGPVQSLIRQALEDVQRLPLEP